jgi:hypothetical protein
VLVLVALTCAEARLVRRISTVISRVTVTVERDAAPVIAGELGAAARLRGGSDQHDGQDYNQQSDHSHRQTWNKRPQYRPHPVCLFHVCDLFEDASNSSDEQRQMLCGMPAWPNLRYHVGICMEGLSKTSKHFRIVFVPAGIRTGHLALPIEPTRPATRLTYEIQVYACN